MMAIFNYYSITVWQLVSLQHSVLLIHLEIIRAQVTQYFTGKKMVEWVNCLDIASFNVEDWSSCWFVNQIYEDCSICIQFTLLTILLQRHHLVAVLSHWDGFGCSLVWLSTFKHWIFVFEFVECFQCLYSSFGWFHSNLLC